MQYLFLLSAVYNLLAAAILFAKPSQVFTESGELVNDKTQSRTFTSGTLAIFAGLDFYLYLAETVQSSLYAMVLLAVLVKVWSFGMIAMNLKFHKQPIEDFIPMGLVNGIFMILFIGFLS